MVTVPGRILSAPSIQYRDKGTARPTNGSWNMKEVKFVAGANIRKWSYFQIRWSRGYELDDLASLVNGLARMMKTCGLQVQDPLSLGAPTMELDSIYDAKLASKFDAYFSKFRKDGVELLFVVIPEKHQALYAKIKYYGDVKYGLHTVCSVAKKIREERGRDQYFANIALKFNLKKGGVNWTLPGNKLWEKVQGTTMLVGVDVTHPSPGSKEDAPSIAGVVASIKKDCAQWPASLRLQTGRKEQVLDLTNMMAERLRMWQKHNGQGLPQNILIYRDGVSEGQYVSLVLEKELPAIQKSFEGIYQRGKYPNVTIVVVGKRHHTRFYPTRTEDMADSRPGKENGNPKSGTVVDRGITREREWGFFLQAHHGLQGTAKPAHYVILKNDMKLKADDFEQLVIYLNSTLKIKAKASLQTHNLCYLFGRATKAVSVCPPAYMADLVVDRARFYLFDVYSGDTASTNSGSAPEPQWAGAVHPNLKDTMFYI